MASLLDHISNREVGRAQDNFDWMASSAFIRTSETDTLDVHYATRYRLELRSLTEYWISHTDAAQWASYHEHPAHRHAKRRLIHHVYGDQIELAHKLLDAAYGGGTRKDIVDITHQLLESMRYNGA